VKPSVVTGERVASLPHGCMSSMTHRLGETGIVLKRPVVAIVEQARKGTLRLHIPTCFGNLKDGCKLGSSGSPILVLSLRVVEPVARVPGDMEGMIHSGALGRRLT